MPYTPPDLHDHDLDDALSAANVKAWLTTVADYFEPRVAALEAAALREVVVPFAWDDADLGTGKHIYTPTVGDRLLVGSGISVSTIFDGSNSYVALTSGMDQLILANTTATDTVDVGPLYTPRGIWGGNAADYFTDTTPLLLTADDLTGTQNGEGEVRLLILPKGT